MYIQYNKNKNKGTSCKDNIKYINNIVPLKKQKGFFSFFLFFPHEDIKGDAISPRNNAHLDEQHFYG